MEHLDPRRLADALIPYASATAFLSEHQAELMQTDFVNAERGPIPLRLLDGAETRTAFERASFVLLAFGIVAALASDRRPLETLRDACQGDEYRSVRPIIRLMASGEGNSISQIEKVAESVALAAARDPIDPDEALRRQSGSFSRRKHPM